MSRTVIPPSAPPVKTSAGDKERSDRLIRVEVSPGAHGKPYLKRIVQRNGNAIEISSDRVQHFDPLGQPTRALLFERNGEGRISVMLTARLHYFSVLAETRFE